MKKALALFLVSALCAPALGQDGGIARAAYLCPDAPLAEKVDGGWFVSDEREKRVSCLMAACAADRDELEAQVAAPVKWILASLALGFGAGVVTTAAIAASRSK